MNIPRLGRRPRRITGTFPFALVKRRARAPGWVRRRRTEPWLSTTIVELPAVEVPLPRDWEPTVRSFRPRLERQLVLLPFLSLLVVVAALVVSASS